MITAIIPIDLARRPFDIIKKAELIARHAKKENIKIVFGHNDRGTIYDYLFFKKIKQYKSVKIKSVKSKSQAINSSRLRNVAFQEVSTEFLLLLDVDIYPDFHIYFKYLKNIKNGIKPFYIFPCMYLTKYGSNKLLKNKSTTKELTNKFYAYSRKEFLHLASPSSITLMRSSDYLKLNGFNESYEGHGFEDFDFLIKLGRLYEIDFNHDDLLINKTARSPLFAVGFRKYLGELCLEILFEKDITFHLFHPKHNNKNYYSNRNINLEKFRSNYGLNLDSNTYSKPTLINDFLDICVKNGVEPHEYSILFENKPGHIDRYDTLRKKIRFLIK